ncbi:protein serine/threonine phosphatase 2C [Polyporus arcularius HHB13444]|uniref:Protein serine/threonine phosphatase 2C n=1 Tax=Polyporus arcularius HHB13444 TaxID=1314778 RepID=A0A5C3NS54_9APHY|nr:protein serine/threonine phosphatase 2C [Polyporus arcularius HHB13444]
MSTLNRAGGGSKESKDSQDASGSTAGRTILLSLFGMWAAAMSCLSNAAVSLEGDLDTRRRLFDADQILRRHEKTTRAPAGSGITRYDFSHVGSNEPAEDDHQEVVVPVPSGYWSFFGIFDGHNGGDTSKWLADNLILAVVGGLGDLYSGLVGTESNAAPEPTPSDIATKLKDVFNELDDAIVNEPLRQVFASNSRQAGAALLGPAWAGSCALLSFYDSHSRMLHLALTGDSRAVLGRRRYDSEGELKYDVYILTTDQNAMNPRELERLTAEHPGENVVQNSRVFGMGVSRAFGDARLKWTREVQDKLKRQHLGRSPLAVVKTPPYLTAEPEVTSIEIQPGDFLIMGSDGLWESLTSEEAVGLVGLWKEGEKERFGNREPLGGYAPHTLPVWMAERDDTQRYRQWGTEKRFARRDGNAATHLLRNALGGADRELIASLLSMKTPKARTYRDDMTAIVVFFSDEDARKSA